MTQQILCANIHICSVADHISTSPILASLYLKFDLRLYIELNVMQMYRKTLKFMG